MIDVNDFIPLEFVHPGSILCEELKARRIRQRDFARQIGMNAQEL
jgi:plasmid maintenance system antidote protein VapI